MTTRQLSAALERMGRSIPASGITRMEKGERVVTVDELVALAAVLRVSPTALLLPHDGRGTTEVTGVGEVPTDDAYRWVWCMEPLRLIATPGTEEAEREMMDFLLNSRPIGMLGGNKE